MADEGGVLGNLPRSRPGRRSAKRAPEPNASGATSRSPRDAAQAEPPAEGGLARQIVGAATSLVGGGARAAHGIAHEALRRLPRP